MDGCGRIAVPSDTASVWMSEMELVTLFDVIAPTLRAAIRAVYKSGVLQPCEVERHIRLTNGYYADVYALPMVLALAYATPYWEGCVCEKTDKCCGSHLAASHCVSVSECSCVSIRPCIHTSQVCPKK